MRRTNYGTLVNDNEINDNEIALNYIVETARTMGMKVSDDTAISVKFCFDLIKKVKESKLPPCEDAISRQAVLDGVNRYIKKAQSTGTKDDFISFEELVVKELPPVNPQEPKTGHCKNCKYFEYDSVARVDGIPLIVAHEICSRWGDGCKTKEGGYCFLFEPQESEDKE